MKIPRGAGRKFSLQGSPAKSASAIRRPARTIWLQSGVRRRPSLRRRPGVGVQAQFHDTRHSLTKATPRSTPIPSNQSAGTEHVRRDPYAVAFQLGDVVVTFSRQSAAVVM